MSRCRALIAPPGSVDLVGAAAPIYSIFDDFPDVWTWVGAAIIIASGLYTALRERRLRDPPARPLCAIER